MNSSNLWYETIAYRGPKKLEFELPFAVCKNKCMFCSNYGGTPVESPITREVSFKIISDFEEVGGETLVVTGGEPLECPFYLDLIKYAKSKGLRVYVYTAGYLVNEKIAKDFSSADVNRVYVTVLGSKKTHDWITQVSGSYECSIRAIKLLINEGIYVGINFIPMKLNWQEWKYTFQTVAELGVNEFRITELMPQGRAWDNRRLLELNLSEYSQLLTEMSEQLPSLLAIYSRTKLNTEGVCFGFLINDDLFPLPTCSAGKTGLTITPEGYVIPCLGCRTKPGLRVPDKKYILAKYSLLPYNLIERIWHESEVLREFKEMDYEKIEGVCKGCKELKRCKGGCPIRREIETGSIYVGPDYKCILKNEIVNKNARRDK
jgi:radical SAM protein with 4Fe4S-binding SPASM domain